MHNIFQHYYDLVVIVWNIIDYLDFIGLQNVLKF